MEISRCLSQLEDLKMTSQGGFNFDFVVELLMESNQSTGN